MNRITSVIKRYPLASYFALAYALAWSLVLLRSVSMLFGLLALFGPTAAAILVTASTDGRAGIRGLFRAESNVICSIVPLVGRPLPTAQEAEAETPSAPKRRLGRI